MMSVSMMDLDQPGPERAAEAHTAAASIAAAAAASSSSRTTTTTSPASIRAGCVAGSSGSPPPEHRLVREAFVNLVETLQQDLLQTHSLNQEYKADLLREKRRVAQLRNELQDKSSHIKELAAQLRKAEHLAGQAAKDSQSVAEIRDLEMQGLRAQNRELAETVAVQRTTTRAQRDQILHLEHEVTSLRQQRQRLLQQQETSQIEQMSFRAGGRMTTAEISSPVPKGPPSTYLGHLPSASSRPASSVAGVEAAAASATATVIAMERETLKATYDDLLAREREAHRREKEAQAAEVRQLRLKTAELDQARRRAEIEKVEAEHAAAMADSKLISLKDELDAAQKSASAATAAAAAAAAAQEAVSTTAGQATMKETEKATLREQQRLLDGQAREMAELADQQHHHLQRLEEKHRLEMEQKEQRHSEEVLALARASCDRELNW